MRNKNKLDAKRISGYIMFYAGFLMLIINALSYLFDGRIKSPQITVLGLIFVAIGMKISKRSRKK